ncbi:MAG: DinB family protein [Armatimonadota bacterium]|nr:DinB family protein [Armatimonadota bacterium]MDR5704119.1 DinB family protein [Armatimonadota bacterium]MDR7435193.1 DinB family protein [Armatimonadota bacterium]
MEPVPLYAYLEKARERLFGWVLPLSLEQYTRSFPFGLGSIRATLLHMASAEFAYAHRIVGEPVPPPQERPFTEDRLPDPASLWKAWRDQAEKTRRVLADIQDWSRSIEYKTQTEGGKVVTVRTTAGGIAAQLVCHEVHHRAQVMAMLKHMGIKAENLDYSFLMFEREVEG